MAEYGAAARGPLAGASFDPRGCDAGDTLRLSAAKRRDPFDEPAFLSLQSRRVLWRSHVLAWLLQHEVVGTNHEDARRAAAALCKACPDFGSLVRARDTGALARVFDRGTRDAVDAALRADRAEAAAPAAAEAELRRRKGRALTVVVYEGSRAVAAARADDADALADALFRKQAPLERGGSCVTDDSSGSDDEGARTSMSSVGSAAPPPPSAAPRASPKHFLLFLPDARQRILPHGAAARVVVRVVPPVEGARRRRRDGAEDADDADADGGGGIGPRARRGAARVARRRDGAAAPRRSGAHRRAPRRTQSGAARRVSVLPVE